MASQYPDDTKAAVMASLMAGQSVTSTAKEYDIPKQTVSRWKNEDLPVAGEQYKTVGDLLMEYLKTNLATLKAQAEQFADKEWLSKQPASEVAVLHGVMTDKAIRLLEAMSKVEAENEK